MSSRRKGHAKYAFYPVFMWVSGESLKFTFYNWIMRYKSDNKKKVYETLRPALGREVENAWLADQRIKLALLVFGENESEAKALSEQMLRDLRALPKSQRPKLKPFDKAAHQIKNDSGEPGIQQDPCSSQNGVTGLSGSSHL